MNEVATRSWRPSTRLVVALNVVLAVLLLMLVLAFLFIGLSGGKERVYSAVAGVRPLHVIYGPGVGDKPLFDHPMGAALGRDGRVYVADTGNNRVVVFDANANYLFEFGSLGVAKPAPGGAYSWKPGLLNYPTDVTTDDGGNVYVADFRNNQIQVFDADGRFVSAFPDPAKKVGKGASGQGGRGVAVTSICVHEGRVYATDAYQVLVFTTEGELLAQFGKPGMGGGDYDHPNGIAYDERSGVIVSDSNNGRVVAVTPAGEPLWTVGSSAGFGTEPVGGVFELPRGVTSTDGGLIVADSLASRLQMLSVTGKPLSTFGRRGDAPGEFNFPTDVAARGDRLVVAEKGSSRVQVVILELE